VIDCDASFRGRGFATPVVARTDKMKKRALVAYRDRARKKVS
jgi:hypothetical protein